MTDKLCQDWILSSYLWLEWYLFCQVGLSHFALLQFHWVSPLKDVENMSFTQDVAIIHTHGPLSLKSGTWLYNQMLVKSSPFPAERVRIGEAEPWVASISDDILETFAILARAVFWSLCKSLKCKLCVAVGFVWLTVVLLYIKQSQSQEWSIITGVNEQCQSPVTCSCLHRT